MNNRYRFEEDLEKDTSLDKLDKDISNDLSIDESSDKLSDEHKQLNKENKDDKDNKETNETNNDGNKKIKKLHKKIDELEKKISELEEENKNLKNANLMVKADEINFKKRIEAEKDTLVKYGNQRLLEKLVGELDLFDKVVNMPTNDPTLKNYLIGFEMINNNFKNILNDEGVKKIVVKVGDKFDPKYHHVLQTDWNSDYEENVILAELRGGYTYKDRVLCTSLVKVNKKEENENNKEPKEDGSDNK
ncbi:MAG: nucleotide exchange factor GrpE [Bacilli bacterium]|nr:nucleotide exchange factor GrpE [Bacilli bacterium]